MLNDKILGHPAARWVALTCYIIGMFMMTALNFVNNNDFWAIEFLGGGALLIWIIPITWCAWKWSKS